MKKIIAILLFTLNLAALGHAELSVPAPISSEQKKDEIPTYVYKSAGMRDPFIPLSGGTGTGEATVVSGRAAEVNIAQMVLKGYVFSQQRKHALFKGGDGNAYVLDKGKLIDEHGRTVPGVAGIVKQDKVILINKKNIVKEFKLREESE